MESQTFSFREKTDRLTEQHPMIARSPLKTSNRLHQPRAFSLVEVALALGLVSFALVSVMGLLPAGLRIHKDSIERQRAWETVQQASVAVTSQRAGTNNDFIFCNWLSDSSTPISWRAGAGTQNFEMEILESGDIRQSSTPVSDITRQKMRVEVIAPTALSGTSIAQSPATVKVSVAWPASARWSGDKWANASGFVDTVLYAPTR